MSVKERLAVRAPEAVGLNVTLMVQFAFAATELPQVFVCAKSALFAPVMEIAVRLSGKLPVLVSVTDCAALVVLTIWVKKLRLLGERDATAACSAILTT